MVIGAVRDFLASFSRNSARLSIPRPLTTCPMLIPYSSVCHTIPRLSIFFFTPDGVAPVAPIHAVCDHGLHIILRDSTEHPMPSHHSPRHPHPSVFFDRFLSNYLTEILDSPLEHGAPVNRVAGIRGRSPPGTPLPSRSSPLVHTDGLGWTFCECHGS